MLAERPPRIKDQSGRPPTNVRMPAGLDWYRFRPVIAKVASISEIETMTLGDLAQLHLALDLKEDVELEAANRAAKKRG